MPVRNGQFELLVIVIDVSMSMYKCKNGTETLKVNKHQQVNNAIQDLMYRISKSTKGRSILISFVLYSEKAEIIPCNSNMSYDNAINWLSSKILEKNLTEMEKPESELRKKLGINTSFGAAFEMIEKVISTYFSDGDILPSNKIGTTIILFSDGQENVKINFMDDITTVVRRLQEKVYESIKIVDYKKNFSLCTVCVGNDANVRILKSMSTSFTNYQNKNLERLKDENVEASNKIDPLKCCLVLDAEGNNLSETETEIIRKFLVLVTQTPELRM